ncbi:MAG: hypothetical protein VW687_14080 [Curvibacter sp.]
MALNTHHFVGYPIHDQYVAPSSKTSPKPITVRTKSCTVKVSVPWARMFCAAAVLTPTLPIEAACATAASRPGTWTDARWFAAGAVVAMAVLLILSVDGACQSCHPSFP